MISCSRFKADSEYERAKILERGPTRRRHAARSDRSARYWRSLWYRYVVATWAAGWRASSRRGEAHIVRLIFAWIGLERASMREVCRRLERGWIAIDAPGALVDAERRGCPRHRHQRSGTRLAVYA